MSWLRQRGIETFSNHNPTWDVRVISAPNDIELKSRNFARRLPKMGDWTGWRMLKEHGGFVFHSDAVYFRPIPDEWLEYDLCAQLFRGGYTKHWDWMDVGDVHQIPAFGAKPGNPLMSRLDEVCLESEDSEFHNYGIALLDKVINRLEHADGIRRFGTVLDIPAVAFCPYGWKKQVDAMWGEAGPPREHTDKTIGIHWYAGHPCSSEHEASANKDGSSWLERIAATGDLP